MIDQIQTILQKEKLSASHLAEKLGIQRSSISHILSERNKPSLDFIQKLLEKFPHISAEWILTGKGSYLKTIETKKTEPTTPSTTPTSQPIEFNFPKHIQEIPKETKSSDIATLKTPDNPNPINASKKTIKVITLYNDGTFDEFSPNQKA
jgi:transcriptional regulator with XRE-family HTH domain